jgi:hypothetical protein
MLVCREKTALEPPLQIHLHCSKNLKQIFPEMKLFGLVPNFYIHVSESDFYIPSILIWNLISSQSKKEIDYIPLYLRSVIFQIGNMYVGHLCELSAQPQEGTEGRELPSTSVWWQFPALLSIPVVEPRVLSCHAVQQTRCSARDWE